MYIVIDTEYVSTIIELLELQLSQYVKELKSTRITEAIADRSMSMLWL